MTDTYTGGSNQLTQGFHQPTNSHLGLNDFQSALVHVYPNPSSGIYYLDLTDGPDQIQVTVLDARGRLVLTQTLNGTGSQLIDLSDVESGMYILKLFHQDQEIFAPIKLQKTL